MRPRRFVLVAILFAIIHFALSAWSATALVSSLHEDQPFAARLLPSEATALFSLPLYPLLAQKFGLSVISIFNSLLHGLLAAVIISIFRWWSIAVYILIFLLLAGGAMVVKVPDLPPAPHFEANPSARVVDQAVEAFAPNGFVNDYLNREVARGDDDVGPQPQEVDYYLVAHRAALDGLEHHLLTAEAPRWESSKEDFFGVLRLSKVLLVDALQSAMEGDAAGAWQRVDAARRLTEPLQRQPRLVAVLVAIAAESNQLGVARKLAPPAQFPLQRSDPHARLIAAITAQAATVTTQTGPWYVRPYVHLAMAESVDSALRQTRIIENLRGCRFEAPAEAEPQPRVPFNPFGVLGGGERYAIRANRLLLDYDFTQVIVAAKSGHPPPPAIACRNVQFNGNALQLQPPLPAPPPALPARHALRKSS